MLSNTIPLLKKKDTLLHILRAIFFYSIREIRRINKEQEARAKRSRDDFDMEDNIQRYNGQRRGCCVLL